MSKKVTKAMHRVCKFESNDKVLFQRNKYAMFYH